MFTDILFLAGGLALIIQGGNLFVAAAVRIAQFLRMPRVVIGSTLVSLATTTPELVVSIMSGLKGESGLAVGNAVGSCICNVALILGITAMIKNVEVHPKALRSPLFTMGALAVVLLCMTLDLTLSRWQGAVLIAAGLLYFVRDFVIHWRDRKPADMAEAAAVAADTAATGRGWFRTRTGTAVQFLCGAAVVVLGSRLLVDGAVSVAGALSVPSIIIGLTVVAVGTSLPELITAVASSRSSVSDLAVGNVLGANIANLSLIVGTAAVIQEVQLDRATQVFSFPVLIVLFALLLWKLLKGHDLTRREGITLLSFYGLYLAALTVITVWR